jgi:hypothetical protein
MNENQMKQKSLLSEQSIKILGGVWFPAKDRQAKIWPATPPLASIWLTCKTWLAKVTKFLCHTFHQRNLGDLFARQNLPQYPCHI